jgi:hypothetical protein
VGKATFRAGFIPGAATSDIFRKTYQLPKVPLQIIWQHWWPGDNQKRIPPWRLVPYRDINDRRRFADLKYLVRKMVAGLEEDGVQINSASLMQANELFARANELMGFASTTRMNRKRRNGQLI